MDNEFNKIYLDPNIYCVENFISKEEAERILNAPIDYKTQRQDLYGNIQTGFFSQFEDKDFFNNTIENRIRLLVDNSDQRLRSTGLITKYIPDIEKRENDPRADFDLYYHYENHPGCDYESRFITYGLVLYFNDDYEGGELVFEHKPIEVKPKALSIMVFPGSEEYSHAVKNVIGKERVVYSAFVYQREYWEILNRSEFVTGKFYF